MLVLGRRTGEAIIITVGAETIRISVEEIKTHNQVVLGIEAPRQIRVMREELVLDERGKEKR